MSICDLFNKNMQMYQPKYSAVEFQQYNLTVKVKCTDYKVLV